MHGEKFFLTIFVTFVNAFLDIAHSNCQEKPAKNHDELHVAVAAEQFGVLLSIKSCMYVASRNATST